MRIRYKKVIISVIILCALIGGVIYYNKTKINVQHLEASLTDQKSTLQEVIDSADIIVEGKIKKSTPVMLHEVLFTDYEIDVKNVLKGQDKFKNEHFAVRLLGGTLDRKQEIVEGIKQFNQNENYILCLKKVFSNDSNSNIYSPVGANQGIISFDELGNDKMKIKKFNPANNIETLVVDKELNKKETFK